MPVEGSEIVEIRARFKANINTPRVMGIVNDAVEEGLLDTVVDTAADVVKGSAVLTGHNRRSIDYWVRKLHAMIFGTSGYSGYLETGTSKMAAQPYFKPAADKNFPNFARNVAKRLRMRGG